MNPITEKNAKVRSVPLLSDMPSRRHVASTARPVPCCYCNHCLGCAYGINMCNTYSMGAMCVKISGVPLLVDAHVQLHLQYGLVVLKIEGKNIQTTACENIKRTLQHLMPLV